MCRDAQTVRYFSDGITAFRYLTDSFFLKFGCKSWCAHTLLLCSNYRAGSSTGVRSVHVDKSGWCALSGTPELI
ncbi:hypothetical protein CC666_19360 [Salmonella enterica subsp. enterica serovar Panama]|nr:hypothetical protein [Salmonella enterica subsp. enterica serovar Panama]